MYSIKIRQAAAIILGVIFISGCAQRYAIPQTNMKPTQTRTEITLSKNVEIHTWPASATMYEGSSGLAAGKFVAVTESDQGIFYSCEERCVWQRATKPNGEIQSATLAGGLWVPKGPGKPQMYWIVTDAEVPSSLGLIPYALVSLEKAEPNYFPPIDNPKALEDLAIFLKSPN